MLPRGKTREETLVRWLVSIVAVAMSLFHLYTAGFGLLTPWLQRSYHLLFAITLVILLYPLRKDRTEKLWIKLVDGLLLLLGMVSIFYIVFNLQALVDRAGDWNRLDSTMGIILVLVVLEMTRRVTGNALPIVAIVFLLYGYFGDLIPGALGHRGYTIHRIATQQFLTLEGLFGLPLGVSATFVFMFILFGAFLEKSGMGQYFIDLSYALTGRAVGGPAKTAVIASGFLGSITGSAVANVVTTGAFTIPLMKKVGYKKHFAGAVEAAASTGGQIMPPIMGASAFIIAEFLAIEYVAVVIAAAIPALLYFASVGTGVHYEAKRLGLKGLSKAEIPDFKKIIFKGLHMFIPFILLLYLLIIIRYTPLKTGYWVILATVVVSWFRKETAMKLKEIVAALELGARNALAVIMACACAGLVIGIVTLTGVGLRLSSIIIAFSGGNLLAALVLATIGAKFLGMGLPTTATYLIMATLGAPALMDIGVAPLAAHMFVFYAAITSAITPPVALAAYAGAAIAGSDMAQTGVTAMKIALAGFIVPFMFVYTPELLMEGTALAILLAFVTAVLGVVVLSAGTIGFLNKKLVLWERFFLLVSSLALMKGGIETDVLGLALAAVVFLRQYWWKRQEEVASESVADTPISRSH
ncbi:TRAP transporter permease [candidate division NPL-UPA2 bacterium]|nr:TRAP transporter permease [candidate division NPL-UPA2 bacterium]